MINEELKEISIWGHKLKLTEKQIKKKKEEFNDDPLDYLMYYYKKEALNKWKAKPYKERVFEGTEYEFPSKKIGKGIYQLVDIYPYNLENPEKNYDDQSAMIIEAQERYKERKEDKEISGYRIIRKKGRIEIWVYYK